MVIGGREVIYEAIRKHPEWKASLESWLKVTAGANWSSFPDVRKTWKSADYVRPYVIFNVSQNRARLVTTIVYVASLVQIHEVLDHKTYDRRDFR
jgi:mRNA interferase HigB